jgi:enterochelin esterase-like enzyme
LSRLVIRVCFLIGGALSGGTALQSGDPAPQRTTCSALESGATWKPVDVERFCSPQHEIDLHELVQGLREREIHTPVVIRFTDMVRHRLTEMRTAFDAAIKEHEYQGTYSCVYPIKVNQQRQVCEQIRDIGVS